MINYKNEEIIHDGCPGCAYGKGEFTIPCGNAYENDNFTLSQDWELPIVGSFMLAPKRHVEKLTDLTLEEQKEMFMILSKALKILEENVCERYNVLFEEKENRHFHVWLMPRQDWMKEVNKAITKNLGTICEYAKANYRNEETYEKIEEATKVLRKEFNK